jgi:hypothetical protein
MLDVFAQAVGKRGKISHFLLCLSEKTTILPYFNGIRLDHQAQILYYPPLNFSEAIASQPKAAYSSGLVPVHHTALFF